jgi:pimeloyl-ACP methyl ester carboxylesterase
VSLAGLVDRAAGLLAFRIPKGALDVVIKTTETAAHELESVPSDMRLLGVGEPSQVPNRLRRISLSAELGAYAVSEVSWRLEHSLVLPSAGRILSIRENKTIVSRIYEPRSARHTVLCVHGYSGGHLALDGRLFPVGELLAAGFRVCLTTLPLHAARSPSRVKPDFPGFDQAVNIEAIRMAVIQIRQLVAYLQLVGDQVSVLGMSLGGYLSALAVASNAVNGELQAGPTATRKVMALGLMVPLASYSDFLLDRYGDTIAAVPELGAKLTQLYTRLDPTRYAQTSCLEALVLHGKEDHIVPLAHSERLAKHFDARTHVFPGSHLIHGARKDWVRALVATCQSAAKRDESTKRP